MPPTLNVAVVGPEVAEALLIALVGAVLLAFFRVYRRGFLRDWAFSWLCYAVFIASGAAGFVLSRTAPEVAAGLTTPLRIVGLIAGFWQAGFLAIGSHEVATGVPSPPRQNALVLAGLLVLGIGIGLVQPGAVTTTPDVIMARVGVRAFVLFVTFVAAGIAVLRSQSFHVRLSRSLVGAALIVGSLRPAMHLGNALYAAVGADPGGPLGLFFVWSHSNLGSILNLLISLLLQVGVAVGVVAGLLEEERDRADRAAAQADHLALYDPLTGLANRRLFADHVALALKQADRADFQLSVLVLNLDRFKEVNNALGRGTGDAVLRSVGERLQSVVRRGDTVARLAGDVFGVLITHNDSGLDGRDYASRLHDEVQRPLRVGSEELYLTACIGVAASPDHGSDAELLLRNAEHAAWMAKKQGGNATQVYEASADRHTQEQLALERSVRRSLELEQLEVHYQPIADLARGTLPRVEALVRWHHPRRGLVMPSDFIPVAEHVGIVDALDLWVLREAAAQVMQWCGAGLGPVRLSVNCSARAFYHPELAARIGTAIAESGLPPSELELEITESVAMEQTARAREVFGELKHLGIHVAIDDFGTGYSSLAYLRNFPIDTLKLDRTFVRDIGQKDAAAVCTAVITLAHTLGMAVVAEGVETAEQLRLLREQGCDFVQGFLISPPRPGSACADILAAGPPRLQAAVEA